LSGFHHVVEVYCIPLQLACAMLGMGATLSVRDFLDVIRDVRGLALGLALQLLFVPALAYAFIGIFDLSPGWAIGLCLIAVVPGGAFSNLLTFLGKGNVPLSISVTVTSTVASVLTVPLLLRILAAQHLPAEFAFPTHRIVVEIGGYLLVPLTIGMIAYRFLEQRAQTVSRWGIRASLALLVVITFSSLQSGRIDIGAYGVRPPLLIIAFGVVLAVLTPQITRALGRYDDDTIALACEVAVRNMGIGLLLVRFFFPGEAAQGQVLYSCLFYAGLGVFLAAPIVIRNRLGKAVVPLRGPRPRVAAGPK